MTRERIRRTTLPMRSRKKKGIQSLSMSLYKMYTVTGKISGSWAGLFVGWNI